MIDISPPSTLGAAHSKVARSLNMTPGPQLLPWMLATVAFCAVILAGLLHFPPLQYRRALLTCNLCGNSKEIHVWTRWYQISHVYCEVSTTYPVPADHVHRWWQWDGHHETRLARHPAFKMFSTKEGWSRGRYEDQQNA